MAIASAHDPKLLLLEEPTAGVAPTGRVKLMQLTADIVAERNISGLFIEHDIDFVFTHAHRVMMLKRGVMIANGSFCDIRNDSKVQEVYPSGGTLFAEQA